MGYGKEIVEPSKNFVFILYLIFFNLYLNECFVFIGTVIDILIFYTCICLSIYLLSITIIYL
jgi:hypothetical protein